MNKFDFGDYDSDITDVAFSVLKGYVDPASELETRKQLSTPLKELKDYINDTVTVDGSDNALQLVLSSGELKYRTQPEGTLNRIPSTCLTVTSSSFSSLPQTISDSNITSEHVVVNSVLSNPSAQTGDWTVTTSAGSLTISGTISGSTTITLYLMRGI